VLLYGDEIGMGDDPAQPERGAVRTAMQWTAGRNGGFSEAARARVGVPIVRGELGPARVNVASQLRDEGSLLAWLTNALRVHARCPELGEGAWEPIATDVRPLLALRYRLDSRELVVLHNLAPEPVRTELELDRGRVEQLLGDGDYGVERADAVQIHGYGYRWLRVTRP
jgi:glycosidase